MREEEKTSCIHTVLNSKPKLHPIGSQINRDVSLFTGGPTVLDLLGDVVLESSRTWTMTMHAVHEG
jgi:hypothetical protein